MTAKLMLFFDYDTQWAADRSRAGQGRRLYGMDEFICTDRLLNLLAEYHIHACFAVVGAAALPGKRPYHDPAQIRKIHALGHEIASHSMHHDWLPAVGPKRLRQDLRESRDALEQCIGAPVTAFVPPFNQPFDYWRKSSISLSERRQVRRERIDLPELCRALAETGYRFARVSYRSLVARIATIVAKEIPQAYEQPRTIHGILTLRLNTPCGFDGRCYKMLAQAPKSNGYMVVYGHPHSLDTCEPQAGTNLAPFLSLAGCLARDGRLEVLQPRQAIQRNREMMAQTTNATI